MTSLIRRTAVNVFTHTPNFERFMYRLSILYGLWLLNPFSTTFSLGRGYAVAASIAPEYVWGLLFTGLGVRLWYATHVANLRSIKDGMFGVFIIWTFFTIMLVVANPWTTGTPMYSFLCYNIFWSYLTLSQRYTYTIFTED
jgi:hypothetical protein